MFCGWPDPPGSTVAEQPWIRAVPLQLVEARGSAPHKAPVDAVFIYTAGAVRFVLEGTERELQAGDGVVPQEGQMHAVTGGAPGRAVLLLRRAPARASSA